MDNKHDLEFSSINMSLSILLNLVIHGHFQYHLICLTDQNAVPGHIQGSISVTSKSDQCVNVMRRESGPQNRPESISCQKRRV